MSCRLRARGRARRSIPPRQNRLAHLGSRHQCLGSRRGQRRRAVDPHAARLARHRPDDERRARAGPAGRCDRSRAKRSTRSTCSAWAAAACAPKCCDRCSASSTGHPRSLRARHDRRAHDRRRGRAHGPGAHAVPRREQERRHGRGRVDGTLLLVAHDARARRAGGPPLHRDHRSRHRAPRARRIEAVSRGLPQPGRHRRPLLRAVAVRPRSGGADRPDRRRPAAGRIGDGGRLPAGESRERRPRARRVHRRGRAERTRQAHGRPAAVARVARPLDRAARRREHRQARQGRAAGRGRTARETRGLPATIARSSRSRPIATGPTTTGSQRSKRPDIRCFD